MLTLLHRFWVWLITDPYPEDPDRNTTGWN